MAGRPGEIEPEEVDEHRRRTFLWMHESWLQRPNHARAEGRPLLLNFGPLHVKEPADREAAPTPISPRPLLFALHHLWKDAGADGRFTWIHWNGFQSEPPTSWVTAS